MATSHPRSTIFPPSFHISRHSNGQSIKKKEIPFHSFEYISLSHPEPPFILSCILERIQKGRSMILCVVKHPLSNQEPFFLNPAGKGIGLLIRTIFTELKYPKIHSFRTLWFSSPYFTLSKNSTLHFTTLHIIQYTTRYPLHYTTI